MCVCVCVCMCVCGGVRSVMIKVDENKHDGPRSTLTMLFAFRKTLLP